MKNSHLFHRLSDEAYLTKAILEGKSIQDVLEYTHEDMVHFYQWGCDLFERGEYQKASDLFFFLLFLNNNYDTIWLSYGLAEQKLGNYSEAISAYFSAIYLNPDSVQSYLQACYCARELKEWTMLLYFLLMMEENVSNPELLKPHAKQIEEFRNKLEDKEDE